MDFGQFFWLSDALRRRYIDAPFGKNSLGFIFVEIQDRVLLLAVYKCKTLLTKTLRTL
jgi:hypothetical protein